MPCASGSCETLAKRLIADPCRSVCVTPRGGFGTVEENPLIAYDGRVLRP
jgi:hypothetical protein